MNKAPNLIIVTGPESSGTRLVTSLFNFKKMQRDDIWEDPTILNVLPMNNYIIHRSMPHYAIGNNRRFFDPVNLYKHSNKIGYNSNVIICMRDRTITKTSKINDHNRGDADGAEKDLVIAAELIKSIIKQIPAILFSYETFMHLGKDYLDYLELPYDNMPKLIDGNIKYL